MKASRVLSRTSTSSRAASSSRCLHQHQHQHLAQPVSQSTPSTATLPLFSFSTQRRTLYNTTTPPAARRPKSAFSKPQHHRPQQRRPVSTTLHTLKGIQPDSADPAPPDTAPSTSRPIAAEISESEYHEIADEYLDTLVYAAEELSESVENGIDVEYSAGVLTIIHPTQGSYVINKQPPNKQIWLSSPVSGPKRYDWVVAGKDAAQHEKEGSVLLDDPEAAGDDGAGGKWIYIRDGSGLSDLLKSEIGVAVVKPPGGDD